MDRTATHSKAVLEGPRAVPDVDAAEGKETADVAAEKTSGYVDTAKAYASSALDSASVSVPDSRIFGFRIRLTFEPVAITQSGQREDRTNP